MTKGEQSELEALVGELMESQRLVDDSHRNLRLARGKMLRARRALDGEVGRSPDLESASRDYIEASRNLSQAHTKHQNDHRKLEVAENKLALALGVESIS